MSIESESGSPHEDRDPIHKSVDDQVNMESDLDAYDALSDEERAAIPVVQVTEEEHRSLLHSGEDKSYGKAYSASDALALRGVRPNSGFVRLTWPNGRTIVVTTRQEHFGGLVE